MCHIETGLKIYQALGAEREDIDLTIFPDCGHFPHLEKPEVTAKHIVDFVKKFTNYVELKNNFGIGQEDFNMDTMVNQENVVNS